MKVKNDYNECLTNLACSIRKYFELDYKHNTLAYIDKMLDEYKPKNVVTILCDGMGSNIIDRVLTKDDFLIKNRIKAITTVFPATTVAATTSITTGLNPSESGMLGWNTYFKGIDKIITTFIGCLKEDPEQKPIEEVIKYRDKYMITKTIMDEINEIKKYKAYTLYPFGENPYTTLDDMYNIIEQKCSEEGKKYIYAYDIDPDHTMHKLGSDSTEVYKIIKDINKRIQLLSTKLKDTIIIVVADHGHLNVENIYLEDYNDLFSCLKRSTSIESRAVNFFVLEEKKQEFVKLFDKYFGQYFDLYTKEDVIESKLFGDGKENVIFRDEIGDYLAIGKSNIALMTRESEPFVSQHAGYTEDEIMVPLILIKTKKDVNLK